ncbi:hypothetical protein DICVIV_01585 [Dictyocaulus viviparus]|uniref:Uncharacterized protein n=1 Tax=Dictyocaulus viviparus TaxID=29172 RepID=A0A0D8Y7U9_DICVI|nr:hypothetical protein DICVIV_01585 [Dictyocaulus viviparus]
MIFEGIKSFYRELYCENELKQLHSHLNEAEDQLVRMEFEIHESRCKIDSLTEEVIIKKKRIKQLENSEKLYLRTQEEMEARLSMMNKQVEQMQRHHEIQKEKLLGYKGSEEKWEAKIASLEEMLEVKNNTILLLERRLRDAHDELLHSWELLKNRENDSMRLRREVEELRRNAEIERDEYNASVADWRNRLEKTIAENLAACAADMDRNAYIAREMREKTEEVEKLQKLLEMEKKHVQNLGEEIARRFRENMETLTSNGMKLKGGAELETLCREKKKLETERDEIFNELQQKKECLKEAMIVMECLRDGIFTSAEKVGMQILFKENSKDNEDELYEELREIVKAVKWYIIQFEEIERRFAVHEFINRRTVGNEHMYTNNEFRSVAAEDLINQEGVSQQFEQCERNEDVDMKQDMKLNDKTDDCFTKTLPSSEEQSELKHVISDCSMDSQMNSLETELTQDDVTGHGLISTTKVFSFKNGDVNFKKKYNGVLSQ